MKLLVVAGAPRIPVKSVGVSVVADPARFSLDAFKVVDKLVEDGHDVTVLTTDPRDVAGFGHASECGHRHARVVEAASLGELTAKLKYLASEVGYDGIVSLVMLPPTEFNGVYTSAAPYGSDEFTLSGPHEEAFAPSQEEKVWLRFDGYGDDTSQFTDLVHGLGALGDANVVCLEAIPARIERGKIAISDDLISIRNEYVRSNRPTVAILDVGEGLGAFVVGKNGGSFVEGTRLFDFTISAIVEAATISRERVTGKALPHGWRYTSNDRAVNPGACVRIADGREATGEDEARELEESSRNSVGA